MKRLIPLFVAFALFGCNSTTTIDIQNDAQSSSASAEMVISSMQSDPASSKQESVIQQASSMQASSAPNYSTMTETQWKAILNPDQYHILREAGTERPFTSPLLDEHRKGTFVSADCGEPLFRSETKFDSGTGWPSFYAPISPDAVIEKTDSTLGMERTEVLSKCGGHLGHVFTDGPPPTGLRYCMNGLALRFIPDKE
jgi:peptide-methionine (R)-S-oxide reductase